MAVALSLQVVHQLALLPSMVGVRKVPRGGGQFFLLKSIESSSWHLHPTILRAKNEDFFVFYFSM